jgi:hypothetical protein
LKPEWWGSPLVQEEKYQEKPVKREEKIIIITIIIIICGLGKVPIILKLWYWNCLFLISYVCIELINFVIMCILD